jgi:hypothetical protein
MFPIFFHSSTVNMLFFRNESIPIFLAHLIPFSDPSIYHFCW